MSFPERDQTSIFIPGQQPQPQPLAAVPPPAPTRLAGRRRPAAWILAAVGALVLLGGGAGIYLVAFAPITVRGSSGAADPAISAATSSSRPSGSTVAFEPGGAKACAALGKLYGGSPDAMYDPDQLQPIGEQAVKSTDMDIRFQGQMLIDRAKLARAAKGKSDEAKLRLEMSTTAVSLLTRCTKAGYPTT